jgi:hypothetical protein
MEIVMISLYVSLSATSSMHGRPINRVVPPIVPYVIASLHLYISSTIRNQIYNLEFK